MLIKFAFSKKAIKIDEIFTVDFTLTKGGFKSEDPGEFLQLQHKYSKLLWIPKLFTVLGGKFKFSAQDSDLEYYVGDVKNF